MNSRVPSERAYLGKFKLAPHKAAPPQTLVLSATALTMSGWPTTTSAGWPFEAGILFQIKTRLNPKSATKRCVPSEVTETGLQSSLAAAV